MTTRRIVSVVLAIALCAILGVTTAGAAPLQAYSLVDIVTVAKAIGGQLTLDAEQTASYDANGDGALTIADLVIIAESLLVSSNAAAPDTQVSAQPTVCPTCMHYPCICSVQNTPVYTPRVCATCGQYPCVCDYNAPSQNWTCGTCHQYPCICDNTGYDYNYNYGSHGCGSHHGSGHHC